MADILIRGMEMPNKDDILVFDVWHGKVYARSTANTGTRRYEVVSLPEGHGRLGDLDALMNNIGDVPYKGAVRRVLMSAPTVIEADLEWKMKNCCCFSNADQAEGENE